MEILRRLDSVISHHKSEGLSQLFNTVETQIKGLQALGVTHESYGKLLSSILT